MQELLAEQLGKAMALCSLGGELVSKHESLLTQQMDEDELDKAKQTFGDHTKRSEELAKAAGVEQEARKVREAADKAFRSMHQRFMDGKEDDPVRVVSWLSLANAGGIAIWAVLDGAAEVAENDELHQLSDEALEFQKDMLDRNEEALRELGAMKA